MSARAPEKLNGWIACGLAAVLVALLCAAPASAQGSSLRYFGYFAARITAAGGNHLAEVGNRSNLNWVQISDPDRYAPEVLDGCAPQGCIISTGHEFFRGCDSVHSPDCGSTRTTQRDGRASPMRCDLASTRSGPSTSWTSRSTGGRLRRSSSKPRARSRRRSLRSP